MKRFVLLFLIVKLANAGTGLVDPLYDFSALHLEDYDVLENLLVDGSDTAYNATTWNANPDAPSKNAVRDKFESLSSIFNAWSDPVDSDILPTGNDNTFDLGSAAASFKDIFWDGTATGNVTGALTGNADTVTTNANLTGEVTSTGNAAVIIESFLEDGGASEIAVTAGMMNSVSMVALIRPPTIGDAIRFITCEPVSVPNMIGKSPIMVVMTVIIFGLTLSTAPSMIALFKSTIEFKRPSLIAFLTAISI